MEQSYLSQCVVRFQDLLSKDYYLTLEDGTKLHIFFQTKDFKHLLGLHKLTDMPDISRAGANAVFNAVLNKRITQEQIEKSEYYYKIKDRIEHFPQIESVFGKEVIVDFNSTLLQKCDLKAEYLMYHECDSSYTDYIHLAIGHTVKGYYPESFFYEPTKQYLSGQIILEVEKIEVIPRRKRKKRSK